MLFPVYHLFLKATKEQPRLMDELLKCHMFGYYAEHRYVHWFDALEHYPLMVANWEELRFQITMYTTARACIHVNEIYDHTVQSNLTMTEWAIRRMFDDVDTHAIKLGLREDS